MIIIRHAISTMLLTGLFFLIPRDKAFSIITQIRLMLAICDQSTQCYLHRHIHVEIRDQAKLDPVNC